MNLHELRMARLEVARAQTALRRAQGHLFIATEHNMHDRQITRAQHQLRTLGQDLDALIRNHPDQQIATTVGEYITQRTAPVDTDPVAMQRAEDATNKAPWE